METDINIIEEPEIKIEYINDFESDPLSDDSYKIDTGNVIHSPTFNLLLHRNTIYEEGFDEQENEIIDYNDDTTDTKYDDNDNKNVLSQNKTWYREVNNSGRYLCKFCDLTYSTVQTLRYHVKTKHSNEAENMKNVVIRNKRNSKLKCHICKKYFKLINDVKNHVEKTHNIRNVKNSCHYCYAVFENERKMLEHLYVIHEISTATKAYYCFICGYRTTKKSHFKQHKNTHSLQKDNKCNFCDYSTNYKPNLKIHERIHTNNRPYVCDFKDCGYQASAKSALKSHQLKHYPEKNMLYCDKCNYKTVYKQSLKKHIDSHTRNSIR